MGSVIKAQTKHYIIFDFSFGVTVLITDMNPPLGKLRCHITSAIIRRFWYLEDQTQDVHNKTFKSAEIASFQNAYSGNVIIPTFYKICTK